jgi:rRNA-processing protein FCF1
MRHGRAKAARKTLRYFERTVNLKSKPYYSVLLDATFLTAMVRITTNTTGSSSSFSNPSTSHSRSQEDDIASRIERVLQVGGPSSSSMSSSDDRTTMDYNHSRNYSDNNDNPNNNHTHTQQQQHNRYNVRYFIPQEAVNELEMIIQSLTEKSTATKKKKKTEEYLLKASLFKNTLTWIHKNTISNKQKRAQQYNNNGNSTTNFNRCEILPKFDDDETQQSEQQQQQKNTEEGEEEGEEKVETTITITATEAVRRHIALDDVRSSSSKGKGKERTYIVASQDEDLLYELRYKGTVPIMRLANKATVLILENPSKSTKRKDLGQEKAKWFGRHILEETEQALVDAAKKSIKKMTPIVTTKKRGGGSGGARGGGGNNDSATAGTKHKQPRKIHGPKEPNPLSCKRKRPSSSDGGNNNSSSSSSSGKISSSKKRRERAKQSSSSSSNNNIEN